MHESQMAIDPAGCSPGPTAESDGMGVEMVGPRGELSSPRPDCQSCRWSSHTGRFCARFALSEAISRKSSRWHFFQFLRGRSIQIARKTPSFRAGIESAASEAGLNSASVVVRCIPWMRPSPTSLTSVRNIRVSRSADKQTASTSRKESKLIRETVEFSFRNSGWIRYSNSRDVVGTVRSITVKGRNGKCHVPSPGHCESMI